MNLRSVGGEEEYRERKERGEVEREEAVSVRYVGGEEEYRERWRKERWRERRQ